MDIKWNKYKKIRIISGLVLIALATMAMVLLLPKIKTTAETIQQKNAEEVDTSFYDEIASELYSATYVLYLENLDRNSGAESADASAFIQNLDADDPRFKGESTYSSYGALVDTLNNKLDNMVDEFSVLRQEIDYAVFDLDDDDSLEFLETNTSEDLKEFAVEGVDDTTMQELKKKYGIMILMSFDSNGTAIIDDVYTAQDTSDLLLKKIQTITKTNYFVTCDYGLEGFPIAGPKNMTIVFGVPYGSLWANYTYNNASDIEYYYGEAGGRSVFMIALLIIFVYTLCVIPVRKKELAHQVATEPKYPVLELSIAVVFLMLFQGLGWNIMELSIWQIDNSGVELLKNLGLKSVGIQAVTWALVAAIFFIGFSVFYLAVMLIEEITVLGPKKWIQKRSAIYALIIACKRKYKKFMSEIAEVDLSEKALKKIKIILGVNFIVLAVISACWVFGWLLLVVYTIVVYYMIKREYARIQKDYEVLCGNLGKLANGKVEVELPETLGQFSKANDQMKKVKKGFAAAVKKEVSSQNMKTELIANVSHDLKTPLTAITTYVGLLQQDNVTPEEQKEYVDILAKKSKRMKELIEDIFDISKANSNNLELDLRVTDVGKLIRQVVAEREDELKDKNLQVRYQMPEGELATLLDGQKAYRIYENLLVNVEKYALEGTRVFIKVYETNNGIVTAICNTSREELDFNEDTITERFTRGDSARNTPGSGLGLAIAKSFAEAMKGSLNVSVDGDMFKVSIFWNK